jgi:hypothetical protein
MASAWRPPSKLTDVAVLRSLRREPVEQPPAELVVDTDRSAPETLARTIAVALDLPLLP